MSSTPWSFMTSATAAMMASARVASIRPVPRCPDAAARLMRTTASMRRGCTRNPLIGKFATARAVWRADARPRRNRGSLLGAGLACAGGRVFVATGLAEVMALDAATGEEIWRSELPTPTRGAINVTDGRVVVLTVEGQVVYDLDGGRQWLLDGDALLDLKGNVVGYLGAPLSDGEGAEPL